MSHDNYGIVGIGEGTANFASDAFNYVADSGFGDALSWTFNNVAKLPGMFTDLLTGLGSNWLPEDVAKLGAGIVTLGLAGYLAKGNGIMGAGFMALTTAGILYQSSDNIREGSFVAEAGNFIAEPYVGLYDKWQNGDYSSNPTQDPPAHKM